MLSFSLRNQRYEQEFRVLQVYEKSGFSTRSRFIKQIDFIMQKVFVLGLDGGDFTVMRSWLAEGFLPNLSALLRHSVKGELASTVPPMTFPAWTTFMTGKNPGKHGVFDCQGYDPCRYSVCFTNASHRRSDTIWKLMSDAGKRVAVLYMPVTYPPEQIDGTMISGWDMPMFGLGTDRTFFHPPMLAREPMRHGCTDFSFPDIFQLVKDGRVSEAVKSICRSLQLRTRAAIHLLKKKDWDCFAVVFSDTDISSHYFWQYHDHRSPYFDSQGRFSHGDIMLKIYRHIDRMVGELLAHLDSETLVMLMSNHGFRGCSDRVVNLNLALQKGGFFSRTYSQDHRNSLLQNARGWSVELLPTRVKSLVFRSRFTDTTRLMSRLRFSNYDWGNTSAYATGQPTLPGVWVNLKGREPLGVVEPGGAYERLIEEIKEHLESLSDPSDGNPVVRKVYRREEVYSGDWANYAPDLLIEYNLDAKGYKYITLSAALLENRQEPVTQLNSAQARMMLKQWPGMAGTHREYGILAISGPGVKRGNIAGAPARISDLAPTLLYYLDVPVPQTMDGVVLTEVFQPDFVARHPVVYAADAGVRSSETGTWNALPPISPPLRASEKPSPL